MEELRPEENKSTFPMWNLQGEGEELLVINEPSCLVMPHDNVSVTVSAYPWSTNYSSLQAHLMGSIW